MHEHIYIYICNYRLPLQKILPRGRVAPEIMKIIIIIIIIIILINLHTNMNIHINITIMIIMIMT